jgi:hypothetical protein
MDTTMTAGRAALDKRLQRIKEERLTLKQIPLWPEPELGAPNDLIRCALFTAAKPTAKAYQGDVVASQAGFTVYRWGPHLDQSHLDVFLGVMQLARGLGGDKLNSKVVFTSRGLLKLIGRTHGNTDRKWLHKALMALSSTTLDIRDEKGGKAFFGSLLPWGANEDDGPDSTKYVLQLNPYFLKMYERGYTRVSWEHRHALRGKPLAQWMLMYFSSHKNPFPVTDEFLREKSGSADASLRSFRQKAKAGLEAVKAAGAVKDFQVVDGKFVVTHHTVF